MLVTSLNTGSNVPLRITSPQDWSEGPDIPLSQLISLHFKHGQPTPNTQLQSSVSPPWSVGWHNSTVTRSLLKFALVVPGSILVGSAVRLSVCRLWRRRRDTPPGRAWRRLVNWNVSQPLGPKKDSPQIHSPAPSQDSGGPTGSLMCRVNTFPVRCFSRWTGQSRPSGAGRRVMSSCVAFSKPPPPSITSIYGSPMIIIFLQSSTT